MKTKTINKGFTLIEVLLVITLIGILLTIALVNFNSVARFADARNDIRETHIQTIESAITQYKLQNGFYPDGLNRDYKEICDPDASLCTDYFDLKTFLVPKYLQAIPKDPNDTDNTGGSGYEIAIDEASNTVSIRAMQAEGEVDIQINYPLPDIETNSTNSQLLPTVQPNISVSVCPTGYIPVPGNTLYGTNNFCVMKYEAKETNPKATTVAAGLPAVSINQTDAATACSNNGAGYGLINNNEWMTIARNIEAQNNNWFNPTTPAVNQVGSGGLWRGHSDTNPPNALAASTDDNPYFGTGNDINNGWQERRTHTLSNGEVIWDLSGNVWEWTDNSILGKDQPTGNSTGFNWREYGIGLSNSITNFGILNRDLIGPSNPSLNSNQNIGQIFSDGSGSNNTNFDFLRGGDWDGNSLAGVFALRLGYFSFPKSSQLGFRCVLR